MEQYNEEIKTSEVAEQEWQDEENKEKAPAELEQLIENIDDAWHYAVDGHASKYLRNFSVNSRQYTKLLFEEARKSKGNERWKYANSLKRFLELLDDGGLYHRDKKEQLKDLMTNEDAVDEFLEKAKEEDPIKVLPKSFFSNTGFEYLTDKIRKRNKKRL